jgi:type VI secretion system protein ImpK
MTPRLAQVIDPIFQHVLDLLERLDRGEHISAYNEQQKVLDLFVVATHVITSEPDGWDLQVWEDTKYAIVSWIDEMLVELSQGPIRDSWTHHVLERQLFGSRDCHERFFTRCNDRFVRGVPGRGADPLEVYYICTLLGFRGLYQDAATGKLAASHHRLPETRHEWTSMLWQHIAGLRGSKEAEREPESVGLGTARPLISFSLVVWPWLLLASFVALNVLCYYHLR